MSIECRIRSLTSNVHMVSVSFFCFFLHLFLVPLLLMGLASRLILIFIFSLINKSILMKRKEALSFFPIFYCLQFFSNALIMINESLHVSRRVISKVERVHNLLLYKHNPNHVFASIILICRYKSFFYL